nr:BspA family leucine-rich repeat surface protein [uncultured Campylobacter sp.]
MFYDCYSFDQQDWDISKVSKIDALFFDAKSFKHSLENAALIKSL